MRVLLVRPGPHFSVEDVASGWAKGLEQNGCEVADFNLQDRLGFYASHPQVDNALEGVILATKGIQAVCYEFQPDVVLIVSGFYIPPAMYQLMRARGSKVVLLHTESPYEDDKQTVRAQHADLNVVNDPTNLAQFPDGSLYLPHCYDPDLHRPAAATPDAVSDFCFVGTGYPSRAEFFEAVDWSGIDVALGGHWSNTAEDSPLRKFMAHDIEDCCPNDEAAVLYASTKASANLYRKEASHNADGWAMGPREVELAACGTFFLREPRPESDEILPMLPTFTTPDDFGTQLRWWLANDDARLEAADAARAAVAPRTFDQNAARLLNALGV
jgi:spore maturation protein CgeB